MKYRRKRRDFGIDSIFRSWGRYWENTSPAFMGDVFKVEEEVQRIKKLLLTSEDSTKSQEELISFLELEVKQLDLVVTLLLGKLLEKNILTPEEIHSLIEISNPESGDESLRDDE